MSEVILYFSPSLEGIMEKAQSGLIRKSPRDPKILVKVSRRADEILGDVKKEDGNSFLVPMSPRNLAFNSKVGFEVFYRKIIFDCKLQLCMVADVYSPLVPWEKIPMNGFFLLGMMPVRCKSDKIRKVLVLRRTAYGEMGINVFTLPDDMVWPRMVFLFRTR